MHKPLDWGTYYMYRKAGVPNNILQDFDNLVRLVNSCRWEYAIPHADSMIANQKINEVSEFYPLAIEVFHYARTHHQDPVSRFSYLLKEFGYRIRALKQP